MKTFQRHCCTAALSDITASLRSARTNNALCNQVICVVCALRTSVPAMIRACTGAYVREQQCVSTAGNLSWGGGEVAIAAYAKRGSQLGLEDALQVRDKLGDFRAIVRAKQHKHVV
eukprot:892808-Pleurochrysis_carterae.AAC.1